MGIAEFRKKNLSDEMISAMLQATEAFAEMNAILKLSSNMDGILHDGLLASTIQYQNTKPIVFINALHSVCIRSGKDTTNKYAKVLDDCITYAIKRIQATEVLTAGDLLKINHAFDTCDIEILRSMDVPFHLTHFIEPIWEILHDLYDPERQYPLLLETAIAFYRLITLPEDFHLPTIIVLLQTVYKNDFAFLGLVREWALYTDPRTSFLECDVHIAVMHILSVFEKTWRFTTEMLYALKKSISEISGYMQKSTPNLVSTGIVTILSKQICIRNMDIVEQLKVSDKTAIGYLKQLEQKKLLLSLKVGREKYYFNAILCDALQQIG